MDMRGSTVPLHVVFPFCQEAMSLYVRHVALMAPFACYTPKHHVVFHLLRNVGRQGNPYVYATWLDESLNKTLKTACRNAAAATFYPAVLRRMRELLRTD